MEIGYRLILYILIANVGFMIFSLSKKGIKIYLGYLLQLFLILLYMIFMVGWGKSGITAISISVFFLVLIILIPLILQRHIEKLISEQRFDEIEPYAKWKANLAWSEPNLHLLFLARTMKGSADSNFHIENELRNLLGKGEPFDTMTRLFIAMIHFHSRQFEALVKDLLVPGKRMEEYSFDELLYLIRGYLETGRFHEAIDAQLVLEKVAAEEESEEQLGNLLVNRLLFFAFLGWKEDYEKLMNSSNPNLKSLPAELKEFWHGVVLFNSGALEDGRAKMEKAIEMVEEGFPEIWSVWMKKRLSDFTESQNFFLERVFPTLETLKNTKRAAVIEILEKTEAKMQPQSEKSTITNVLTFLIIICYIATQIRGNPEDLIDLIDFGANSGFLVARGEGYRIIFSLFLHSGVIHILMNILGLRYFGPPLETVVGGQLFLGIYFFSGICAGLSSALVQPTISVGASGAVLGLLSAMILVQLTGKGRVKGLAPKGSLGAMVFILLLNILIGSVEKGVDNIAHLGGLAGGAIAGIAASLVIRFPVLFFLSRGLSLLFVIIVLGSATIEFQQFRNSRTYPTGNFKVEGIASTTIPLTIPLPEGWKVEPGEVGAPSLHSVQLGGPFGEKMEIFYGELDELPESLIKKYSDDRTQSINDAKGLTLRSVKTAEKVLAGGKEFIQIQWRFSSGSRPLLERDFFHFEEEQFFLVQCLLPTDHGELYEEFLKNFVSKIEFALADR